MKYKTFKAIVTGVAVVLIGTGAYALVRTLTAPGPAPASRTATVGDPGADTAVETKPVAEPRARTVTETRTVAESDYRAAVLQASERTLDGEKVKDAFRARSYKVNLYADPGGGRVKRVKIDLDRDEKWDEKWTFDGEGGVKREVAPADDERYTESYRLVAGKWVKK